MNDMLKLLLAAGGIIGVAVVVGIMLKDESPSASRGTTDFVLIEQWSKDVNQEYMAVGQGTTLLISPGSEEIWFSHLKGHCVEANWSADRCKTAIASYIAQKSQEVQSQSNAEESRIQQARDEEEQKLKSLGYQ